MAMSEAVHMSGEVVLVIDGREFEIAYGDDQDVDGVFRDTHDRLLRVIGTDEPGRELFHIRSDEWTGVADLYVNPANVAFATVYRRTAYEPYSGFAQR
jgi:hypothetical protein